MKQMSVVRVLLGFNLIMVLGLWPPMLHAQYTNIIDGEVVFEGSVYQNDVNEYWEIRNGGQLISDSGQLGEAPGEDFLTFVITGAGSRWDVDFLQFAYDGSGNVIRIENGGQLNSGSPLNDTTYFSPGSGSGNSVLVTGTDSIWAINGKLRVGHSSTTSYDNELRVEDGGRVQAGSFQVRAAATFAITGPGGTVSIAGITENYGTLTFRNTYVEFGGAVVNRGYWITDPTTNVFNNTFTVTDSGVIQADAGDVYIFKRDFINESTQPTEWNTLNVTLGSPLPGTKFIFDDDEANGGQFFVHPGLDLGATLDGFQDNFALGTLEIGNANTNSLLTLSSTYGDGALYVNTLTMFGGSQLIIEDNMRLYFVNSNNWSMANVTLGNNAVIQQLNAPLSAVPEPGVVLLWVCGAATVWATRRRNRNRN